MHKTKLKDTLIMVRFLTIDNISIASDNRLKIKVINGCEK